MFDGCEFDLESGFSFLCMFAKYFEDKINSISSDGLDRAEEFVDFVYLCWLEDISDNQ